MQYIENKGWLLKFFSVIKLLFLFPNYCNFLEICFFLIIIVNNKKINIYPYREEESKENPGGETEGLSPRVRRPPRRFSVETGTGGEDIKVEIKKKHPQVILID